VHDRLGEGRALRVLTTIDESTCECLAAEVDTAISSRGNPTPSRPNGSAALNLSVCVAPGNTTITATLDDVEGSTVEKVVRLSAHQAQNPMFIRDLLAKNLVRLSLRQKKLR
jgi:hypothetical protein